MGYIRVYSGNELKKQFELGEDRVTIGRTDENTLVLADEGVSRQHAAIEYQGGDFYIVDLDSQNGVFLNNEKVEKAKLKYWDEIQIHNYVIKFMSKPGIGESREVETEASENLETDKTKFFNISDEKQLDDLRKKTKECFLTYQSQSGNTRKTLIKKPRVVIGKSKDADLRAGGWFAPSIAATIEKQGAHYELVPQKRGKVMYQGAVITEPTKLNDGNMFSVRGQEYKFFNRLTKTS